MMPRHGHDRANTGRRPTVELLVNEASFEEEERPTPAPLKGRPMIGFFRAFMPMLWSGRHGAGFQAGLDFLLNTCRAPEDISAQTYTIFSALVALWWRWLCCKLVVMP